MLHGYRHLFLLAGVALCGIFTQSIPTSVLAARPAAGDSSLRTGDSGPADVSLRQLSPEAAAYVAARRGDVGVAVALMGTQSLYGWQSNDRFPLASIAKVAILVTVLDRSIRQHQELTVRQLSLLEAMIERSDNDAATTLWTSVGGGGAVRSYLRSIGLTEFEPGPGSHWGASVDSAADIARLLLDLSDGSILDLSHRALALILLNRIDRSQRWGVTAGVPAGALLALKNGWDELPDGQWELNSVGLVVPGRMNRAYAVVILTQAQPSLQYGLQTIQQIAQFVHAERAASW